MYGLLLENLSEYVKTVFGEDKWDEVRRQAGISAPSFGVHDDYDEDLLNHLAKTAQQVSSSRVFALKFFILFLEAFRVEIEIKKVGVYGTSERWKEKVSNLASFIP